MGMRQKNSAAPPEVIAALCTALQELTGAGVAPDECMRLLAEDAATQEESARYKAAAEQLEMGETLSDALEADGYFPPYTIGMIRVGERSGTLESVLGALAAYYDREAALRDSIRSAVAFPLLMGGAMLVLLGVLLAFVMPVFSDAFASIGLTLSPAAAVLLGAGKWLAAAAGALLALAVIAALVCWYDLRTGKLGLVRRTLLYKQAAAGRFASAMALMLHSGLPLSETLSRAGELANTKSAAEAADALEQGAGLSDALAKTGLFGGVYLRMIRVGERAGRAERMMNEVAQRMSEQSAAHVDEQIARIEPAIVALLAIAAGLVLLSVMLPLLGSVAAFG